MILIEIAAVAALAPLLVVLCECWDRRAGARRDAVIARLSGEHAPPTERPGEWPPGGPES